MFNLKSMTLDAIIRTVYSDDGRLRPEQLAELAGPEVSNYDLLSLLCTYLNGLKKVNERKDLTAYCQMELDLEDERKQVTLLERRYHEALSRYLEQARRVVELEDGMTRLCRQVTLLHERLSRQSSQLAGCGISVPPLPALKDLLPAAAELKLSPVTTEKTKAGSSRRQKKS